MRLHFLCIVSPIMKFLRFQKTTALQRLQIELLVRGWKGMSALLRGLTLPISSRTMAVPRWFPNGKQSQFTTNCRPWQDGQRFFKNCCRRISPRLFILRSPLVLRSFNEGGQDERGIVLSAVAEAMADLSVYGLVPFICQFHDLRLLERGSDDGCAAMLFGFDSGGMTNLKTVLPSFVRWKSPSEITSMPIRKSKS